MRIQPWLPSWKYFSKNGAQSWKRDSSKKEQCACQKSKDAKTVSTVGIVSAVAGGVFLLGGAYLFFFAPSDDKEGKAQNASRKPVIVPSLGPGSGSLSVSGVF